MLRSGISTQSLLPLVSKTSAKGRRRSKARLINAIYAITVIAITGSFLWLAFSGGKRDKFNSILQAPATSISTEPLVKLSEEHQAAAGPPGVRAETLVVYVYAGTDPEYLGNLHYFIREGVHAHDGCEYVIVIQEGPGLAPVDPLPPLPPNARFVYHKNECFDLGTVGWVMEHHIVNTRRYKYVIWLNSSVRGPFLPAYVKRRMHWTEALTDRLRGQVKLVGATINCGGALGMPALPHVQSYLAAVDQTGLQVLQKDGKIFHCWSSLAETVIHSELGASAALFVAGHNIDCLMLRYQGVNWRSKEALDCNAGLNPIQNNFNDGINVDPLEVMFIKVKSSMHAANWTHVSLAVKFDEWSAHESGLTAADLQANAWMTHERPRIYAEAETRGSKCFDHEFYVNATPGELGFLLQDPDPEDAVWRHFLDSGIRDGRPFRYTC